MFSWHAVPFARVLIPFITGILIGFYCPSGLSPAVVIFTLSLLSLLFFNALFKGKWHFRTRLIQGVLLTICISALGFFRTYWHDEIRQQKHFSSFKHARFYYVQIDDAVVEKAKFYRCYAIVHQVNDSGNLTHASQGSLLMYFNKQYTKEKPMIGEQFIVKANAMTFNEPANPEEFDYKKYLAYHNIQYQLFSDSVYTLKSPFAKSSIYRSATIFRDQCLQIIRQHIHSAKELGVAEALLLGYKDDLDPDITSAFSRTGTLHVLAVSGLHAGIIFLLISFLTRSLQDKKRGKWIQLLLLLSGIWFYAFMTGLSSSVLRASVMFSIMSIGKILKYKPNIYNTLYASAFLLLLYNPLYFFDIGFQLSYLAVLGIVWIQPMMDKWYQPRYRFDKYLWDLMSVSLAAQCLTFPISLFYFHQFPNYFLISNLLIIPLTTFILIGLILLLALNWIPILALWTGKLLFGLIWLSNALVSGIDRLPYSFINGIQLSFIQLLLLYGILVFFVFYLLSKSKWLIFSVLIFTLFFVGLQTFYSYKQNHQRIFVIHAIKGHDVFTCIEGRKAYLISDSAFLNDSSAIHFFIEPYFYKKGIEEIIKLNMEQTFTGTNIMVFQGHGFQFFDNIMTIENYVHNNVHKQTYMLLRKFDFQRFKQRENSPNTFIISSKIPKRDFYKLKKDYFKCFHKKLELNKKALEFYF